MYAGASAIPSIAFHFTLSACSQIKGNAHSPASVTDTTIGIPNNGAAKGTTTIQPTQMRAMMRLVNAKFLSFSQCSRAADTAFCC